MANKQTILINGRHYDATSGLPVDSPVAPKQESVRKVAHAPSTQIHSSLQKSKTLNRRVVQKNAPATRATMPRNQAPKHMDITRSSSISRFAPRPVVKPTPVQSDMIKPTAHPLVQKTHHASTMRQMAKPVHKPSHVIKNEAISKALDSPIKSKSKSSLKRRFPRAFSVASASMAVLLLAGYLTYLNMPTISIRVAAVQSGINATYPEYRPTGYRLDGPIAYNDGQVSMRFAANAGPQSFNITEKRSNWNSSAVLENYVEPKAGKDYSIHTQSGLTIYAYDNNAAWVNAGVLYTIEGNAPLSKDQVLRIATSL